MASSRPSTLDSHRNSLDIPLLPPSHIDHAAMVLQVKFLHKLQQVIDGADVGVCQLKVLDEYLVVTELVTQCAGSTPLR